MDIEPWAWWAVIGAVVSLLALDLFVLHREAHEVSLREATRLGLFWIGLGTAFGGLVFLWLGPRAGGEYLAGYLIEESLSIDNLFVFALIFSSLSVPARYHHRVLFWGILGALVFRGLFILGGAALLERFHAAIFVFGGLLVLTGVRLALHRNEQVHPERHPVLRVFRRVIPMTDGYRGQRFVVREASRRFATPLLAVLVLVEATDIVFAIDSIPAVFAVTREPFLVFTSNAFAILGLRALYFMLAGMLRRFVYLRVGLSVILVFVGVKMVLSNTVQVPIWGSLLFIAATLGVTILASLRATPRSASGKPSDVREGDHSPPRLPSPG